jgi:hypothetical protein
LSCTAREKKVIKGDRKMTIELEFPASYTRIKGVETLYCTAIIDGRIKNVRITDQEADKLVYRNKENLNEPLI